MKTFLAPNQFLSAASLQPVAETAVARTDVLQTVGTTVSVRGEFISNSAAEVMPAVDTAVALSRTSVLDAQTDAAAAPISESTLDPATGVDAAAAPDLTDPPVAAAADHIHEIFHYARKLLAKDNRRAEDFVDWQALLYTIEEGAELPLFIRAGDHLRRWSA